MEVSLVLMGEEHQSSSDVDTGLMVCGRASSGQPYDHEFPACVMNAVGYVPMGYDICWLYVLCVVTSLLVTSDCHKGCCVLGMVCICNLSPWETGHFQLQSKYT